jgi:hypothetical protein
LQHNHLTSLPVEILKIKNSIKINETSYEINNLDNENEITNLPINTKEIEKVNKKLPFGCIFQYF